MGTSGKNRTCHPSSVDLCQKNTAALTCSTESVCCDEAPAALCGSPESTCCYNPEKTVVNLCGKGSKCNTNTGNCYAAELGQFQCGAIACSEGSVCCEAGYPKAAALCGGEDSTCCYDPVTKIANLCGKGSQCNVLTGHCHAR